MPKGTSTKKRKMEEIEERLRRLGIGREELTVIARLADGAGRTAEEHPAFTAAMLAFGAGYLAGVEVVPAPIQNGLDALMSALMKLDEERQGSHKLPRGPFPKRRRKAPKRTTARKAPAK